MWRHLRVVGYVKALILCSNAGRMFSTIRQTQALFSSFQGTSMLALGDEGEEFDLQVRRMQEARLRTFRSETRRE